VFSTFSCEVPIVFPFYIEMATKSIIMNMPLACSWCVSGCYLVAGSTSVEREIPFEVCGISTFETLILALSVVLSIGCTMRVVQLSRCTGKGCGRNHNLNSLWFSDPLLKVRSRDCPDMTLNLVPNHHVPFIDFVGFLQQHHGLLL
jgi:hypothetical protein